MFDPCAPPEALQGPIHGNNIICDIPKPDRRLELLIEPEPTNGQKVFPNYQPPSPFNMPGYQQNQMLQPTLDFPMNWLPPNHSIPIDYSNIFGLGLGSLDFFSFQNTTSNVDSAQGMTQQNPAWAGSITAQLHANATPQSTTHVSPADGTGVPWKGIIPETTENSTSTENPRLIAHNILPSDAPGGLYATSANGARMPCTVRARRATRLIPGATPLRPLSQLKPDNIHDFSHNFAFLDTSHLDNEIELNGFPNLSSTVYENITRSFRRLCLTENFSYPAYSDSTFPSLNSLNMCIRLYFENFDATMPILHDQITRINDHWILALAVSAIGCQYAEADEYAQNVEPMHELLRRTIAVEIECKKSEGMGQDLNRVASALAMSLSQFGMLYSGSARLQRIAREQHSATVELARDMMLPLMDHGNAPTLARGENSQDIEYHTWKCLILDECRRRICYTLWVHPRLHSISSND